MSSNNKKDLCPQCKTNMKGIRSKVCRTCSIANMSAQKEPIPEVNLTPPEFEVKSAEELKVQAKEEAKSQESDNKDEVNDLKAQIKALKAQAEAMQDKADIYQMNDEPEPEPELEPEPLTTEPSTVGQITPDGKYYV